MSTRQVPVGNGVNWITEAIALILKNPAPFLLMGLVMGVASAIPILGTMALAVLTPALYGGIAWAAREEANGRRAEFGHIAQAFHLEGKLAPMLILALPSIIAGVVMIIVLVVVVSIALMGTGITAATESPAALLAGLGFSGVIFVVLSLILAVTVFAMTFFAISEVIFTRNDAINAIRDSIQASLKNAAAVITYLLVLIVSLMLAAILLSFISPILAQLVITLVAAPIVGTSMYFAWKDVYNRPEEVPSLEESPSPESNNEDGFAA